MMEFLKAFWHFVYLSAPYLLLGLVVAGLVHVFLNSERIKAFMGSNRMRDIFYASLLGVPLPLCSCSVIPTAVSLRKSGASNGATSAFLIATPESGVDSIAVTYAMMDLPMAIIRPVAAFFSAFVAGILNLYFNKYEISDDEVVKSCCSKTKKAKPTLKEGFTYAFKDLSDELAFWLFIGLVAGAAINFLVPENFFMGMQGWQNNLLILLVGIPLYICASATTPIAASMIIKGLNPGAALLLLLVGPATNISNIAVIQKYIGKRGVILNIFSIIFVALIFSSITDFLYENFLPKNFFITNMAHEHNSPLFHYFSNISGVIVLLLIAKGLFVEKIRPLLTKEAHCEHH